MSKWRRIPMIVLALWASLALTLPTLVWSCPITGQLTATAPICAARTKAIAPHAPCCPQTVALAPKAATRCHPQSVPLPQAPHEAVLPAPALQNPALVTTHAPQFATVVIPAPLSLAPSFIVSRSFDAADPLHSQHSPPLESGRAPPF